MKRSKIKSAPYARIVWRSAWRNLRKCVKSPTELAWRLKTTFKHGEPTLYTWFFNHACDVLYNREMPMPKNRLGIN